MGIGCGEGGFGEGVMGCVGGKGIGERDGRVGEGKGWKGGRGEHHRSNLFVAVSPPATTKPRALDRIFQGRWVAEG